MHYELTTLSCPLLSVPEVSEGARAFMTEPEATGDSPMRRAFGHPKADPSRSWRRRRRSRCRSRTRRCAEGKHHGPTIGLGIAHRASDLVASGAIGRPLSARVYSSTAGFGPKEPKAEAYSEQAENGVTLVTIQGAHTIDLAIAVLGPLADVPALATTQYPEIEFGDDATSWARSTPDHLLVQARLASGGALSVEVAGGRPSETPFRLEIMGERASSRWTAVRPGASIRPPAPFARWRASAGGRWRGREDAGRELA